MQSSIPRNIDGRKKRALETQIIVGNNVEKVPEILDLEEIVPIAKRQKTKPSDHSPDAIQSAVNNKNLESLELGDYTVTRVEPACKPSQPSSVLSMGSVRQVNGRSFIGTRLPEYRSVEKTMDSKTKPRRRGNSSQPRPLVPPKYSPLRKDSSTESLPIDISGIGLPEGGKKKKRLQPAYRGTAREPTKETVATTSNIGIYRVQDKGERSRHFGNAGRSVPQPQGESSPPVRDEYIAHQFRDTNGKRKSMGNGSSSDELVSEAPSAIVTDKSPVKRMSPQPRSRRSSPTRKFVTAPITPHSADDELSLPSSIVPQTKFSASGIRKRTQKLSPHKNKCTEEKAAPWGVQLSGIVFAGNFKRTDALGLEYDENSQNYVVLDEGKSLTNQYQELRIQPKKLLRALAADSGGKVRFESSKSGNNESKLDLELHSEKGMRDLFMRLQQESEIEIVRKPREKMERMFLNHLREQCKALPVSRPVAKRVPVDVQLATRNRERDEAKEQEALEQDSHKRQRTTHRVIDRLNNESNQGSNAEAMPLPSRTSMIFKDISGGESGESKNDSTNNVDHALLKFDKILAKEQIKNSHIPISQIETRATLRKPKELSPTLNEFPEEERYSRKQGLGLPWVKSLIYPIAGKKKTTVDWSDLERLDEGQYLNDNLIGFYLRFLEHQVEAKKPELSKKVYFFNTFFFASLTNTHRGKKPINYESVQKWTRGIDIFTYNYVVVPINESAHWYVAIICNLPKLIQDEATQKEIVEAPPQSDSDGDNQSSNERRAEPVDSVSSPDMLGKAHSRLNTSQDLEEQEPTASFADMSLQTDAETSSTKERKYDKLGVLGADESIEDQEMLDAQLTENTIEVLPLNIPGMQQVSEVTAEHTEPISGDPSHKTPLSKKRKRKSIPPLRTPDPNQPIIITFDSLGAAHSPTIKLLKCYLREEGLAKRNGMIFDESRLKGLTAKQLPLQDNFSDCGLFLLGYMEKFLENPKEFIGKVLKREYDMKKDWPKMDPRDMRNSLRELIQKLHSEQDNEQAREKMEKARKAGKFVGKKQWEAEAEPSSDPLQADEPTHRVVKMPTGLNRSGRAVIDETTQRATVTPSDPNSTEKPNPIAKTTQTRGDALGCALTIDFQDPVASKFTPAEVSTHSHLTNTESSPPPAVPKDPSIIIIDSQPEPIDSALLTKPPECPMPSPELATEIADSQPAETISSPPTLPKIRHGNEETWEGFDGLPALERRTVQDIEEIGEKTPRSNHDTPPALGPAVALDKLEEPRSQLKQPKEKRRMAKRVSVVEIDD